MVALLVRLKLTLLRNSLRRSVWRTVGMILGLLYALGVVGTVLAGLIALRWTSAELTADVTTLAFAVLTAGWLLFSLLVFGVDETVDPAKFALLPVRAREMMPGLAVGGLISSPGIATVLIGLGLVITWARGPLPLLGAVVAVPLGIATCFLLSRAATAAFSAFLASRRFRDLAVVLLAGVAIAMGLLGQLAGLLGGASFAELRALLGGAAAVAGWSPFGWAWSLPADLARADWTGAGLHLVLALALIAALWKTWEHFLAKRLVEPIDSGGPATKIRSASRLERLYPQTPAGGVALRTLRYWRRDPRYLAGIAGFLLAPVILIVSQLVNPVGSSAVLTLTPVLLSWLLGMSLAQDLSYDGSAIWLHVSAGLRGRDDRLGRVLSTLTVFGPMQIVLLVVAFAVGGRWDLAPVVIGLCAVFGFGGLGVGCVVGALWQWPAPPPGASPFQKGGSGGLPSLLSFSVSSGATLVICLPVIALAVGSIWIDWLGWVALVAGVGLGAAACLIGIERGGRLLDRRWPEVMSAVGEKVG